MAENKEESPCAIIDKHDLAVYRMYYGMHPWSYVHYTPQQLLDVIARYEKARQSFEPN